MDRPRSRGDAPTEEWFARLRAATADLPRARRDSLLAEIGSHLAEVIPPGAGVQEVRQVLDELGSPEDLATAARREAGLAPGRARTRRERLHDLAAVLLLLVGGIAVPVLGWLAGVVLAHRCPRWTAAQKWLGILTWPVVLAAPVALAVVAPGVATATVFGVRLALLYAVAAVLVVGAVGVHLVRAAERPRATPA